MPTSTQKKVLAAARATRTVQAGARAFRAGATAVFYTHEINEATTMARLDGYTGEAYAAAHKAALAKYAVSPFSVYHPEAIAADEFLYGNSRWMKFGNDLK